MRRRILIIGFYGSSNLGDVMFVDVLSQLLQSWGHVLKFQNPYEPFLFNDYDCILFGGGDTLNDYFISPIIETLRNQLGNNTFLWPPIYGIGLGCPYTSYVDTGTLDIFSSLSIRNKNDADVISHRLGDRWVCSSTDLACLLPKVEKYNMKTRRIGVVVARPIHEARGLSVLDNVIMRLKKLRELYDVIVLIDFNTNLNNPRECDYYSHIEVAQLIRRHLCCNVEHINTVYSANEIVNFFTGLDLILGMRFHSVILAAVANVPVIPLNESPKMIKLVDTLGLSTDDSIDKAKCNTELIRKHLDDGKPVLINHLKYVTSRLPRRKSDPQWIYINWNEIIGKALTTYRGLIQCAKSSEEQAGVICYAATGEFSTPYEYGLCEKIKAGVVDPYNAIEDVKWIVRDFVGRRKSRDDHINIQGIQFIRNYRAGNDVHVKGWGWCMRGLQNFVREYKYENCIFDDFLDATMIWESKTRAIVGQLPYRSPWCGVIHHPFENKIKNNADVLVTNPLFLESLPHCRFLIVFSEHLAKQIKQRIPFARIHVIGHPKEMGNVFWDINKFLEKPRLVQIGGFLRDPMGIYKLQLTQKQKWLNKFVLNGSGTNNKCKVNFTGNENAFQHELEMWINDVIQGVGEIDRLTDEQYHNFLTDIVVFLPLINASACNTLLECLVTCTPVVVPSLPSVMEALPVGYPLIFPVNDYTTAASIINKDNIILAHQLLKKHTRDYSLTGFCEKVHKLLVGGQ
jgi:polysaccharide pyruvyl transferase WcaK-like protein